MRKRDTQRLKALLAHKARPVHRERRDPKALEVIPEHRAVTHPLDLLRAALEEDALDLELEKLGWVLIQMPPMSR